MELSVIEKDLPQVLSGFGFSGKIDHISSGPLVAEVAVELGQGTKLSALEKAIKDIGREMGISGLRVAQIPNSKLVRFEFPNEKRQSIDFSAMINSEEFVNSQYDLPICVGAGIHGEPVLRDLAKMPHLLVAGTTGSGKSVGLNSFIMSLIAKKNPNELKIVLIDPKRIEFSMYNNQQYMLRPIITDMAAASSCLLQLCTEMNNRYSLFEKEMTRNISEYHKKGLNMPYIVCVIDEFADLILFDKNVEKYVQMLAQKSRAAGIHLVIATQRPSVDVITGSVKANLPTRLAYKVASPADSMTILNTTGAEDLLGRGDSLLLEENGTLTRVLGAYASDDYIMETLKPYRCVIKEPVQDVREPEQQAEKNLPAKADKTKESWWKSIGKRNQNKIISALISGIKYIFICLVNLYVKNSTKKTKDNKSTNKKKSTN